MTVGLGHNGGPSFADGSESRGAHHIPQEKSGNWFAVSREIFDHPIVGIHDRPFTDTEAWLYLLSLAAYAPTEVENKGTLIVLDPGQLMAAYAFLAARWKWSPDKVRWYLKRLQNEAMISRFTASMRPDEPSDSTKQDTNHHTKRNTKQRTNQIQILTICNYAVYQYVRTQQNQASHQAKHQPPHQASPQESNTINTLNTKNLNTHAISADAESPVQVGPCETRIEHGVLVNGKTIRHETGAFLISLPAVHAGVKSAKVDEDAVNAKCLARALQWGAAIEAGQQSSLDLPVDAADVITREILQEAERVKAEIKAARSSKKGKRLDPDWRLPKSWGEWALQRFEVTPQQIRLEAERFKDYWLSTTKNAAKSDWERTWRLWCSSDHRAWPTRRDYVPDASVEGDLLADVADDNAEYMAELEKAREMLRQADEDC